MKSLLLECLADRVLVYDGAMGTQLQAAGLSPDDFVLRSPSPFSIQHKGGGVGDSASLQSAATRLNGISLDGCNELLCLTRPEVVAGVHASYLEAGADLIETNAFGTISYVLGEYEIAELVYDLALASAQIAREQADRFSTATKPRFVVGGIGPGTRLVSLGQASFQDVETSFFDL
jgi:5-methyltetrahydrofolate--homocysteine methyltransferase